MAYASRLSPKQFSAAKSSTDPRVRNLFTRREQAFTDSAEQCEYDRKIQEILNIRGLLDDEAFKFNSGVIHNPELVPRDTYSGASKGGGIITHLDHHPDNYYHVVLPGKEGRKPWQGWVPWNPADFTYTHPRDVSRQSYGDVKL